MQDIHVVQMVSKIMNKTARSSRKSEQTLIDGHWCKATIELCTTQLSTLASIGSDNAVTSKQIALVASMMGYDTQI